MVRESVTAVAEGREKIEVSEDEVDGNITREMVASSESNTG